LLSQLAYCLLVLPIASVIFELRLIGGIRPWDVATHWLNNYVQVQPANLSWTSDDVLQYRWNLFTPLLLTDCPPAVPTRYTSIDPHVLYAGLMTALTRLPTTIPDRWLLAEVQVLTSSPAEMIWQ